jgi:type I restriction enzyme, S subunit
MNVEGISTRPPIKAVPSGWLDRDGRRLDCNPYMSGALEAKVLLEGLKARKDALRDVTLNGMAGIFNGPRFARSYVDDPKAGVPFLGSTDILNADLTSLPRLSKKQVATNPRLVVHADWTLITCSGTIGRMAYARPDMEGMAGSQHFMRVVPDAKKIPPGYLYAYLSSKFGVPLVVGGTYGAIIQHIEPAHIAGLPIPRLGKSVEQRAHDLVTGAANARSDAVALLAEADAQFIELLSLPKPKPQTEYGSPHVTCASSSQFVRRGDGYYYAPLNTDARQAFDLSKTKATLGEVADVFIPGIFKRQYATDPAYGVPYITGADVFQLAPTSDQFLLKRIANEVGLVLRKGMIVIQEAGQLGGLIGHSVLVGDHLNGFACSNNMVRVTAKDRNDTGYLFAVLASAYGVRLVSREAAGSSIPHMEAGRVRGLSIPWPDQGIRARIGKLVMEAQRLRDAAVSADSEARALVEEAIKRGAN